jgi:protein TonB
MLRTLLESQASSTRRGWGTAISITVHTAVIALAIAATARATGTMTDNRQPSSDIIYVAPQPNEPHNQLPVPRHRGTPSLPVIGLDHLVRLPVFPTTPSPTIDLARPLADAPVSYGARTPLAGPLSRERGDGGLTNDIYTPDLVEKVVAPRPGNPAPAYPTSLRAAQVEGSVIARFVVDTSGRVEPASINFPEATHMLFADAVRQSLLRSRYLPATIGDHAVRQLVEQRFGFSLTR